MSVRKVLTVAVILLFLGVSVIPSTGTTVVKKFSMPTNYDGNTLYVGGDGPGNYTRIQEAIDDASDGDTVFVFDDSSPYYEKLEVDVSINLIGEDRDTTIIDSSGSEYVVHVSTDYVNISGFTIHNGEGNWREVGIDIISDYNTITDNNISNNYHGICIYGSSNNITGNNITSNNDHGICIYAYSNNIISNNISNNDYGIDIYGFSTSNNIIDNNISSNDYGILLRDDSISNIITGNNISSNDYGIYIFGFSNNINGNNITSNNDCGIEIYGSSNNITGNNISNNYRGIYIYYDSSTSNNIISNNISNNGHDGIGIFGFSNNIISNNISNNGHDGIGIFGFSNNNITGNNISNNDHGICISYSNNNAILKNNFLDNKHHAFFKNCTNTWKQNYWNRPRILPKLIFGIIKIGSISIPWINIDWCPAKEPYEIVNLP